MAKEVYSNKLADPRWQRKRLEVFSRDNWTCQHCGDKTTQLEIHHTDYWQGKEPWEYPGDMLITICRHCHGAEQVRFKSEQFLINALRHKGFLGLEIGAMAQMIELFPFFREELKHKIKLFIDK